MKRTHSIVHRLLTLIVICCAALFSIRANAQDADAQGADTSGASAQTHAGVSLDTDLAAEDEGPQASSSSSSALESRLNSGLVLGGKVGGGLGKPWSDFGATPVFELELGYALPPLHRAIELFFTSQYTQPGISGTTSTRDPRLPGNGLISYDLTQQELTFSLGGLYRIDVGSKLVMPYGGLGGRMYLLQTQVKGSTAGQAYAQNAETQTKFGFLLLGGAELFVGPGALLAELSFGWAHVNSFVLRDTNLGALNLALGYRLML